MHNKTTTHKFKYSHLDVIGLIKADIAKQLKKDTIPIINYKIDYDIDNETYAVVKLTVPG
jgi:hypothetical protein